MKLSKYDGQRVRITTVWGDVLDGNCQHNSADYNEHEFGRPEEGLQFPSFLLFQSDIKKVQVLKNGFPTPFGRLEEIAVEDGADIIEEVFLCEDDEHTLRLLLCLKNHLETGKTVPDREKVFALLEKLLRKTNSAKIRRETAELLSVWKKGHM